MITLEEIQQRWAQPVTHDPAMWDSQADREAYLTVPTAEDDGFIRELLNRNLLRPDYAVLDVGAGTGAYSAALAPHIRHAHAVDLSPKMIANGQQLVADAAIDNVTLEVVDWHDIDLDARGWRGAYDLVFVHNSPALSSSAALDNVMAASRRHCAVTMPTHRHEPVIDSLYEALGWSAPAGSMGVSLHVINELLLRGYRPQLAYEDTVWVMEDPVEQVITFLSGRLGVSADNRPELLPVIADHLHGLADEDGKIRARSTTTIQMIFWDI